MAADARLLRHLVKNARFASRFLIPARGKGPVNPSRMARESSSYVASGSMVDVQQEGEISIVKMSRAPVNSFSLEFLEELNLVLEDLENDRSCRGIILTSSIPNVFSAGLDLKAELYNPREARLRVFWRQFQEFWLRLYGSKLVSVAAVNGHAIAGGCVAAISCDHRIMASGHKIGLTETKVGLALPPMVEDTVHNTIGYRKAELVLSLGMVFSSDEALEMQLVNEVLPEELVLDQAKREMQRWLKIPDMSRSIIKQQMRQKALQRLQSRREEDIDDFVSLVTRDSVQLVIGNYIAGLKKK